LTKKNNPVNQSDLTDEKNTEEEYKKLMEKKNLIKLQLE
jgi:hypothetical protein